MKKAKNLHIRTQQILIRKDNPSFRGALYACQITRRIKNATNFLIQHNPTNPEKLMSHSDADKWLKKHNAELYTKLPSALAQRATQITGKEWKGFFESLKSFKKAPLKFKERPQKPRYANKATTVHIGRNGFKIEEGTIFFANNILKPIRTQFSFSQPWNVNKDDVIAKEIRIVPKGSCFIIEMIYDESKLIKMGAFCPLLDKSRKAGIDLGINNLIAIASNQHDVRPALVNGRPLKSINAHYNKRAAKLRSLKKYHHIQSVSNKRNRSVKDYLHKTSLFVASYCIKNNIGTIVIGKNDGWKQDINMGKINNQKFVQIPHAFLIDMITYKCLALGINVVVREESYTSKASALDGDFIPTFKDIKTGDIKPLFSGRRIKRGLYKSKKGLINADINGALNILKKETGEALLGLVCRGLVFCPVIINFHSRKSAVTKRENIKQLLAA